MSYVFAPGRLTLFRIKAAIVLYLNIGLFFFAVYRLLVRLVPDAFSGVISAGEYSKSATDLLYVSFAALIGTNYDAITPATRTRTRTREDGNADRPALSARNTSLVHYPAIEAAAVRRIAFIRQQWHTKAP